MKERQTYIPPEGRGLSEEEDQIKQIIGKKLEVKEEWKHFTPRFVGVNAKKIDLTEMKEQINQGQYLYEKSRVEQNEGYVRINTKYPVTIFHLGDLHLGSVYTDTDEVFRKIKRIKETPNAYIVFMSNLIDNAIPAQYPDSMLANAIPPNQQVMMMRAISEDLNKAGKILGAVTSPCHEGSKSALFKLLKFGGPLHEEDNTELSPEWESVTTRRVALEIGEGIV